MYSINNDVAQFLLELAKQNDYSNNEIKSVEFTDVISVQTYTNNQNRDDSTTVYCVYADYIDSDSKTADDTSTAEFYFTVEYSRCYAQHYSKATVYYLYAINQH